MDKYKLDYPEFLKEWEREISEEYKKDGIIEKDGKLYKDGKEIIIIDERDPFLEWSTRQTV